jgi:nucleotide sugar dehydrogenase
MKIFGVMGKEEIKNAFSDGEVTIAVYGLGKIGLPLAAIFSDKGAKVVGVDINEKVVDLLNRGKTIIKKEPGLEELVERNVLKGNLKATIDQIKAAKDSDVMIIIVPTLLNKEDNSPDLSKVEDVCKNISKGLERGDFVILESTVPPNTTRGIVKSTLEEGSGLKAGIDFGLAHCPERTSSGRVIEDITGAYPKIVGGINEESNKSAKAIYSLITKNEIITTDSSTAEMAKIFQGLYRDVNIALANELAIYCKENSIDFSKAREIGNTDPNCNIHKPGAGVGGHCIPVYPHFVIKTSNKSELKLLKTARKVNDYMPFYLVGLIKKGLNEIGKSIENSDILILGLAYRGNVKEIRNSPAIPIIKELKKLNAKISVYDPLFSREEIETFDVIYVNSLKDIQKIDCIAILTDHDEFKKYEWKEMKGKVKMIVDGRQIINPKKARELGFIYEGI